MNITIGENIKKLRNYLPYLGQERYDPVRKEERFITVKEKMEKLAK